MKKENSLNFNNNSISKTKNTYKLMDSVIKPLNINSFRKRLALTYIEKIQKINFFKLGYIYSMYADNEFNRLRKSQY
jgi:hypothetical protein